MKQSPTASVSGFMEHMRASGISIALSKAALGAYEQYFARVMTARTGCFWGQGKAFPNMAAAASPPREIRLPVLYCTYLGMQKFAGTRCLRVQVSATQSAASNPNPANWAEIIGAAGSDKPHQHCLFCMGM